MTRLTDNIKQSGFTLIELVVVIVILGILAASALPRFVDLGKEARVASVHAMEGTINTTVNNWAAICLIRSPCSTTTGFYYLTFGGKTYLFQNGYPEAGDVIGGDQIDVLINSSGFTVSLPNNLKTMFAVSGAPDPATCSVTYQQAASLGQAPVVTVLTSGC